MIPEFPNFKSIGLEDKEDIEEFTRKYRPYSDFNFVSMWSWDIRGEMQVSQLNKNLVVKFTDYLTDEHFFSFLGHNEANQTAEILINFSKEQGLIGQLKLIPEESIQELNKAHFLIQEDDNHFDYVYDNSELMEMQGSKFESKRGMLNRFFGKDKNVYSKTIDPLDAKTRTDILKLNYHWVEQKRLKDPYFDIKNELIAIDRFLGSNHPSNYCCVGTFIDDILVGYSINEIVSSEYAIGHFYKTNKEGSFVYLMRQTARHLHEANIKYLNFEQDLGVPGLRQSKISYRPSHFLKKYIIT